MARIVWSPQASDHLESISRHIESYSPFYARQVVRRVLAAPRLLRKFPEWGAVVPEFSDPVIREIHVYSYRIVYRLLERSTVVRIAGVVHAARLLTEEMLDPER